MGQTQKTDQKKAVGQLPKIVLELCGMISSRDAQGQPAGPMTFLAALGRRTRQVLELAEAGEDGQLPAKFLGIQVLKEFSDRVLTDFEETWKVLDAIDAGTLKAVPQAALDQDPEPKDGHDDHADGNGTDPTDPATRSGDAETGD